MHLTPSALYEIRHAVGMATIAAMYDEPAPFTMMDGAWGSTIDIIRRWVGMETDQAMDDGVPFSYVVHRPEPEVDR